MSCVPGAYRRAELNTVCAVAGAGVDAKKSKKGKKGRKGKKRKKGKKAHKEL